MPLNTHRKAVRPNANCANKHNAIAPRPPKPCKSGARPMEQKTVCISLGWIKKNLSWHNDVAAEQWNNAKKWVYSHKQLLSIHPTHSPIQTLYILALWFWMHHSIKSYLLLDMRAAFLCACSCTCTVTQNFWPFSMFSQAHAGKNLLAMTPSMEHNACELQGVSHNKSHQFCQVSVASSFKPPYLRTSSSGSMSCAALWRSWFQIAISMSIS